MNERISDLLDRASDDAGTPLGFSGVTVLRRARARQRRRQGGMAVGLTAAAVTGLLAAGQLARSPRPAIHGPSVGPSTSAPGTPSPTPQLDRKQQAVVDACAQQRLPSQGVPVGKGEGGVFHAKVGDTIKDTSSGGRRASFLEGWTLDASVRDDLGLTATFVNGAHTRWASCDIAAGGTRDADGVWTAPLPTGPVPQSWYGPDGFRHRAASVSWSQVCASGEGKVCSRELFAGTFARYAGVASARVNAPDGTVLQAVFGRYTYVFRHVEQRVAPNRASNDMQTMPSMPVTLLDAQGHRIIRYDYFPPYIVPGSCPPSGGC